MHDPAQHDWHVLQYWVFCLDRECQAVAFGHWGSIIVGTGVTWK
jgi:hypothetical protein